MRTAARTVARKWEGILEADDAEQDIWVHLLEAGTHTVRTLVDMDRPARISALNNIGTQLGSEARDDYEVYSGNYTYGTDEVRDMLEGGAMGYGEPGRTDTDSVAERIDLQLAVEALANSGSYHYAALFDRYVLGNSPLNNTIQKRVERGVDALTREMNRVNLRRRTDHDNGPGSRRAISNERAIVRTTTDYTYDGRR